MADITNPTSTQPNRPFKIDGISIPTPTEYVANIEDLSTEETGRTLDGVMHKDIVATKNTYNLTWKKLSWEDMAILLNALHQKQQFTFTHIDPRWSGRWVTGTFYVGKRSGAALDVTDTKRTWKDISMTFIEV